MTYCIAASRDGGLYISMFPISSIFSGDLVHSEDDSSDYGENGIRESKFVPFSIIVFVKYLIIAKNEWLVESFSEC